MNIDRFRVEAGKRLTLKHHRPDFTDDFTSKKEAAEHLAQGVARLKERQALLYARGEHALLLIFQGMDASGKDSAITHVMSGASPLGVDVRSFKQPTHDELAHTFLWRASNVLPARGRIGLFNRSYYEDVLVVRVHPELLDNQRLPADRVSAAIWKERFEDINDFERHLWRNGTIVRKFFLHVSKGKQRERLLERLDDPAKQWKFSVGDLPERARWKDYMAAYEDALAATSSKRAPWYVIPADHKWFAHVAIAEIVVKTLDDLDLAPPRLNASQRRGLAKARRILEG